MDKKSKHDGLTLVDPKILEHVRSHYGNDYRIESISDLLEILTDEDEVHSHEVCRHRWWTTYFFVVKIGDKLIGFENHRTDDGEDRGQEFDPRSICEVEEYQRVIKAYRKKQ